MTCSFFVIVTVDSISTVQRSGGATGTAADRFLARV
jgi:hypothetical protein